MTLFSKLHKAAFIQVIQRILSIKAVQKVWCFAITDWEIYSEHYHYSRKITYAQHNDREVLVNLKN
jgi:hypothetical protein